VMAIHQFTLTLNRRPTDEEIDGLHEAGCDDATVERGGEVTEIHFDREADSIAAAVVSAARDIATVPGLWPTRAMRDELVTLRDMAERLERTYESVRLLAAGKRGPGGFPEPVITTNSGVHVWQWPQVAQWLHDELNLPINSPPRELLLADRILATQHLLREVHDQTTRHQFGQLLRLAS